MIFAFGVSLFFLLNIFNSISTVLNAEFSDASQEKTATECVSESSRMSNLLQDSTVFIIHFKRDALELVVMRYIFLAD